MNTHLLRGLIIASLTYLVGYFVVAWILSFIDLHLNFYMTVIPGILLIWLLGLFNPEYRKLMERPFIKRRD